MRNLCGIKLYYTAKKVFNTTYATLFSNKKCRDLMPFKTGTFSMSSFLLMVMHLLSLSLYFSRSLCCSSICLRKSQLDCRGDGQHVNATRVIPKENHG